MRNRVGAGILAIALVLGGCSRSEAQQGPEETRSFANKGFDRVTLAGADSVKIIYGRDFGVSATGAQAATDPRESPTRAAPRSGSALRDFSRPHPIERPRRPREHLVELAVRHHERR